MPSSQCTLYYLFCCCYVLIDYKIFQIPYWSYLNMQFSDAYDVYLKIIHRVDSLINEALDRNTPNWCLLNSCPCCFYQLEDEDNLTFEWLVTIDGNNSLKRWSSLIDGSTTWGDLHKFRTDYWLDRTIVDGFKDDVRGWLVSLHCSSSSMTLSSMINRIWQQIMMIGTTLCLQMNPHLHSLALTGGKMLVQNNINRCLPYSMNLGSLLLHAAIGLSFSLAIWSKAVNCMTSKILHLTYPNLQV